nr:MAG TPA: hypothetical protein [Caudoviricetes sp.]
MRDLGEVEQGLALDFLACYLTGIFQLAHEGRNLLGAELIQLRNELDDLSAGVTLLLFRLVSQKVADENLILLILLLGLGGLLVTAVLAGEQTHLLVDKLDCLLYGRAIGNGFAVQQSLDVLEAHSLGNTSLVHK